ncbi:DUF4192 family protein [Nonomuraea sp. NPDC049709]|uniref:DUF4192 domain-containing protein n=1 Tax=Nonomuraea sp. NPDC049709 TaxID=3154736 RepID=UPI00343F6B0D
MTTNHPTPNPSPTNATPTSAHAATSIPNPGPGRASAQTPSPASAPFPVPSAAFTPAPSPSASPGHASVQTPGPASIPSPRSGSGASSPSTAFDSQPCLTLTSPTDILAAVPYLVGFHPTASLIVIGLARGQAKMVARWGLPFPRGTLDPMTPLFDREGITEIVIVGYGPGELVTPAADEARLLAAKAGVHVGEALRAHEGRYWSYVCHLATCCPAEGTPYDLSTSQISAEATVCGLVALPDREALERTLAPVTGPVRMAMRRATAEAIAEFRAQLMDATDLDTFATRFVSDGLARVRSALATHAEGGRLDDAAVARLGLDLAIMRVRDEAWTLMHESHSLLWKDLTRRLEPRFMPPAASLLAMAAWRAGNSVQATIALERALTTDPGYSMANLLMHALQNLLSPAILRDRLPTPAELDATMGPANAAWLLPLINLLDEDDPPPTLE